jgi:hypothetical protein
MKKIASAGKVSIIFILIISLLLGILFFSGLYPETKEAQAAVSFVQTAWERVQPGTSISATFTSGVTTNNLIVAVCSARDSSVLLIDGFAIAINQTGTPSQGIFYKIADGGETTIICQSSADTRLGLHIYEYSGIDISSPFAVAGSASGNNNTPSSGTVTANINNLLVAGIVLNTNSAISGWTNTFVERNNFVNTGAGQSRSRYGGADKIANAVGEYETSVNAETSGDWRGQIVAFKSETAVPPATWKEDEDTPTFTGVEENIRLRILIANATGSTALDYDYRLEYASKSGGFCGDDEGFTPLPVNAVAEHFEMSTSLYFIDGEPTTPKLTMPDNYNFVSGRMVQSPSNSSGSINLPVENYTEIEFVFQAKSNAAGVYCFRLTNIGMPLDEYSIYPELEIVSP